MGWGAVWEVYCADEEGQRGAGGDILLQQSAHSWGVAQHVLAVVPAGKGDVCVLGVCGVHKYMGEVQQACKVADSASPFAVNLLERPGRARRHKARDKLDILMQGVRRQATCPPCLPHCQIECELQLPLGPSGKKGPHTDSATITCMKP
eukprot:1154239-Pelagomonas_calceolata.AAC.6